MKKFLLSLGIMATSIAYCSAASVIYTNFGSWNGLTTTLSSTPSTISNSDGQTLTICNGKKQTNSSDVAIYITKSSGYIQLPEYDKAVTSITLHSNPGASGKAVAELYDVTNSASIGTVALSTANNTTNYVIDVPEASQKSNVVYQIKATSAAHVQISYIEVTYADDRQDPELSFDVAEMEAKMNQVDFVGATLNNPHGLEVTWSSDNEDLVYTDGTDYVIGEMTGTATITASFEGNDTYKPGKASYTINVVDPRETPELSFAAESASVNYGTEFAGLELNNPENLPLTWTSSDEEIVLVEDGEYLISKPGTVTITASFAGNEQFLPTEASYTLTVVDTRTTPELSFAAESANVNLGEEFAGIELNNPENLPLTWRSSDENVAIIVDGEYVIGEAGTTVITASFAGNEEFLPTEASYTLTVVDPNAPLEYKIVFSELGYEDAKDATNIETANYTVTFDKGNNSSNATKYYSTGTAIRLYGGNKMTVSVPEGYVLTGIDFTTDTKNSTFVSGATVSYGKLDDLSWTCGDNTNVTSLVLTNGGTSGHTRIQTMTIKCAKAAVKQPLTLEYSFENAQVIDDEIYVKENVNETITIANLPADVEANVTISAGNNYSKVDEVVCNVEGQNIKFDFKEAGTFIINVTVPESAEFEATESELTVFVHADHENLLDVTDAINKVELNGANLFLNNTEWTSNDNWIGYKVIPSNAIMPAAVDQTSFQVYSHPNGINLEGDSGKLQLITYKNNTPSPVKEYAYESKETGVDGIAADMSEGVIYDLNGRQVKGQPAAGIYVVRQGNKTYKVVVK